MSTSYALIRPARFSTCAVQIFCRYHSAVATTLHHPPSDQTNSSYQVLSSPEQLFNQAKALITKRNLAVVNDVDFENEQFIHKLYRWADITGFFSRWNDRKFFFLSSPPLLRMEACMMTEFERKVYLFREGHVQIFITLFLAGAGFLYFYRNTQQPLPQIYGLEGGYKPLFATWGSLPLMYPKRRCPNCRPYDPECKMRCHEKLRQAGHKLFLDDTRFRTWSTPRINLQPSKFIKTEAAKH